MAHSLLITVEYSQATKILNDEKSNMAAIAAHGPSAQLAVKAGLAFLAYMQSTWMPEALWQGWSLKGRTVAALCLNIPVEGVLPMTNHLESFNCLLKRKYIPCWQRSGARLRFDFLIHILVSKILPEVFSLRRSQQLYSTWLSARFHTEGSKSSKNQVNGGNKMTTMYWYGSDERRDNEAYTIFSLRRVYNIRLPNPDLV